MPTVVTVEWGSRSRHLQAGLRQKVPGASFWLVPAAAPVRAGIVPVDRVADWPAAAAIPLPVTTDPRALSAEFAVPDGPAHVRLDFELTATVRTHSAVVLAVQQLFVVAAGAGPGARGTLLPSQFTIRDEVLVPTPNGPVAGRGPAPRGRRVVLGSHPLLSVSGFGRFSINAEFVDVTALWWKVHPDAVWGWYRHPLLRGRQEHLRVLAATTGGNPMIWFAVAPSRTVEPSADSTSGKAADIVFFRPPPGSNAFPYAPTQAGFEANQHDDTTMVNLARYLLAPVPEVELPALRKAGIRTPELLAAQIQPAVQAPVQPADPMSLMKLLDSAGNVRSEAFTDGRANAFRPVGLENALQQAGDDRLLLLPLGFEASTGDPTKSIPGNPQGGYEAVERGGLERTVQSALDLLWAINAVGRNTTRPPRQADRELWLAGHSEGNRSVWRTLRSNPTVIDRVISFDADTLDEGVTVLGEAGAKRRPDRPLHAFVVVTPNNGDATGLPARRDTQLRRLRDRNVFVSVLPEFDRREQYWRLNPLTNPYLLFLLHRWNVPGGRPGSKTLLEMSAATPRNWNFLFFHELAVFGGDLAPAPGGGALRLRTFFEQALGRPNPRPPLP